MAMPYLNYTETSMKIKTPKKNEKTNKSNLKSFWAFLLSILIYISVFYLFNLSPSTLLCTTKFWFFISNTLIFIIAADFGSFSSSKHHDFYEEYVKNSTTPMSVVPVPVPTFNTQSKQIADNSTVYSDRKKEEVEYPKEKIVDIVVPPTSADLDHVISHKFVENKSEIFPIKEEEDPAEDQDQIYEKIEKVKFITYPEAENGNLQVKKQKPRCARSNSDKAMLMSAEVAEEKEKDVLQRTLSERYETPRSEEDEFSAMSNEELNRRVEEFIQRFNRQIRLQAVRSRQNPELHRV